MRFPCFHLHEKGQLRADGRHNNTVTKREDRNLPKREQQECLANLDVFKLVMLMSFIFTYLRNCLKPYQNLNYHSGNPKRWEEETLPGRTWRWDCSACLLAIRLFRKLQKHHDTKEQQQEQPCGMAVEQQCPAAALTISTALGGEQAEPARRPFISRKWLSLNGKDELSTVSERPALSSALLIFSLMTRMTEEGICLLNLLITLCREGLQAHKRTELKLRKVSTNCRNNLL